MIYRRLVRPALFGVLRDAEQAHDIGMTALRLVSRATWVVAGARRFTAPQAWCGPRVVAGIRFPGVVGLAAGFDKNAHALPAWAMMGFSFVEVGTVTRHPQPGNPKPRVFRLPNDEAIINRFGFNNDGAEAVCARVGDCTGLPIPIGISIGKSKVTPLEDALDDYLFSLRCAQPLADYIAVNVSSPNTPGLRGLQNRDKLEELLRGILAEADRLGPRRHGQHWAAEAPARVPVFLKISPDLDDAGLEEVAAVATGQGVDGLIATNTTLDRSGLGPNVRYANEQGGLSGRPLRVRAKTVVQRLRSLCPALPIIGVGGIMSGDDARAMLDAGADLVQVYTGLVYGGPLLPRDVHRHTH